MTSKPLTPKQRAVIGRQAAAAYKRQKEHDLHEGLASKYWIRIEAVRACGLRISEACNVHFEVLMQHFCRLAGDIEGALRWAMTDGRKKQLIWSMMDLLTKTLRVPAGTDPRPAARQYLKTIVQQQFGNALDPRTPSRPEDCTVKQLTFLRYTVANRCKAMRDRAAADAAQPELAEVTA